MSEIKSMDVTLTYPARTFFQLEFDSGEYFVAQYRDAHMLRRVQVPSESVGIMMLTLGKEAYTQGMVDGVDCVAENAKIVRNAAIHSSTN